MAAGKRKGKGSAKRRPVQASPGGFARKARRIGAGLAALALAGYVATGYAASHWRAAADMLHSATERQGLQVRRIIIQGRDITPKEPVHSIAETAKGAPIMAVDIGTLHDALELLPTVREAHVMRIMPEILYIVIEERQPVAIYRTEEGPALLDAEGVAVPVPISEHYRRTLPVVAGPGADKAFQQLVQALSSQPLLAEQVRGAVYVGMRRWNVRLASGIEVKLPEEDMEKAWEHLAELDASDHILSRDLQVIDMRIDGQLYVRQRQVQTATEEQG